MTVRSIHPLRGGAVRARHRLVVVVAVAALLTTVVGSAATSGAVEPAVPAAPSATATPATGLVQGDAVSVTGTGFPASTLLALVQCVPGDGPEYCNLGTLQYVTSDGSGGVSASFTPRRILLVGGVPHDCAEVGACRIGMGTVPDGSGGSTTVDIQFDPTVPPPPLPTLSVTPDTDLLDDQSVLVSGEGFEPNQYVTMAQCVAPADPFAGTCRYTGTDLQVSPTGSFTVSVTVRRVMFQASTNTVTDCAVAGACVIFAATGYPYDGVAAPIQFDPTVPLPPPPVVTATPDTDLLDGDTVVVSASGFDAGTSVAVIQCLAVEAPGGANCNVSGLRIVETDGSGAILVDLVVDRVLHLTDGTFDCAFVACRIVVADLPDGGYPNGSAAIAFDPTVPPPPPPTLVADPATGLVDGQTITLHGSGYPRNRTLGMAQCLADVPNSTGCDLTNYAFVSTDATGSFTATFTVRSSYESAGRGVVDCLAAPGHCRIGAGTAENGLGADALLTFAVPTPPTVPGRGVQAAGAATVAPSFTG